MSEYSAPAYDMDTLLSELDRLRLIVAEAQAVIDALAGLDPHDEVENIKGRMVPVFLILKKPKENLLLANDIAQIEQEIWLRGSGSRQS